MQGIVKIKINTGSLEERNKEREMLDTFSQHYGSPGSFYIDLLRFTGCFFVIMQSETEREVLNQYQHLEWRRLLAGNHSDTIISKQKKMSVSLACFCPSLCLHPVRYCLNDHVPWHESAM